MATTPGSRSSAHRWRSFGAPTNLPGPVKYEPRTQSLTLSDERRVEAGSCSAYRDRQHLDEFVTLRAAPLIPLISRSLTIHSDPIHRLFLPGSSHLNGRGKLAPTIESSTNPRHRTAARRITLRIYLNCL